MGRWCFLGVILAIGLVSLFTPLLELEIAFRWFSFPNILYLSPIPILTLFVAIWEWRSLNSRSEIGPFIGAIGLFLLSYLGIVISLWPMIVPYKYTLWEASASANTQAFMLVGALFLIPVILMYTGWSYWVFRGKVRADIGYH
jgi:cytochrome d ubiquinol oxidase subunit II